MEAAGPVEASPTLAVAAAAAAARRSPGAGEKRDGLVVRGRDIVSLRSDLCCEVFDLSLPLSPSASPSPSLS